MNDDAAGCYDAPATFCGRVIASASFRLIITTMASTQLTVRIDPSSKRPAIPSNKVGPDSNSSFEVAGSLARVHPGRKAGRRVYTGRRILYTDVISTCVATSDYAAVVPMRSYSRDLSRPS